MRTILLAGGLLLSTTAAAQSKIISYTEDSSDFVNPERGFYIPYTTTAGNFVPLKAAKLQQLRTNPQAVTGAVFRVKTALIYRSYELDIFKNSPLTEAFLQRFQQDCAELRKAGLKMILRFAYTNTAKSGNCTDEYHICPPYGDAPVAVVMKHVQQLAPLLKQNADVIAVMQEGFIGIWGENYFTDYFGDASTNATGTVTDSGWIHRNQLLKALLDALPQSRMVQVRTPQIKQKFVYGIKAPAASAPLTQQQSLQKSYAARIGFHNDCFLSSPDDYGTYYDYGSSTQPRKPANEVMRTYARADSRYTVVGGETCDDAYSPQNDCAPKGEAVAEMERMHYSYLNAAYNTDVSNDWDSCGCMLTIKQRMGYRIQLQQTQLPATLKKGAALPVTIQLENKGFAAPFNPRPVLLVLRSQQSGQVYTFPLQINIRQWHKGSITIQQRITLPATITAGSWQVLLWLPDEAEALRNRPEYSIRLANNDVWEAQTGYNNLLHTLTVL